MLLRPLRSLSLFNTIGIHNSLLTPSQCIRHPSRLIFSDQFLELDKFSRAVQRIKLSTPDEDGYKQNIQEIYEKSGIQSIFTDDIIKYTDLASVDEDFQFLRKYFVDCLRDDIRAATISKPLAIYFRQCLFSKKHEQASALWSDPAFDQSGYKNVTSFNLAYMTLLYRSEKYQEVVSLYSTTHEPSKVLDTLAMASLAKIGTKEAFIQATEIIRRPMQTRRRSSGGRITAIYALFACKLGQYGQAYDILCDPRRVGVPNKLTTSLKILILTEVGRLKEALLVIRSELLPSRDVLQQKSSKFQNDSNDNTEKEDFEGSDRKRFICVDVMKQLTTAIKEENDSELSRELTSLCKALDVSATLTQETLETLVFEPIIRRETPKFVEKHRKRKGLYFE